MLQSVASVCVTLILATQRDYAAEWQHGDFIDTVPTDVTFAEGCQRDIATPALANALDLEVFTVDSAVFLTTKPSIASNDLHTTGNVSLIMHTERVAPFNHTVAIKMKSRDAVRRALSGLGEARLTPKEGETCQGLHNLALRNSLSEMVDTEAREAYLNGSTAQLQFDLDTVWHTGMYVLLSRLIVDHSQPGILSIKAPRFVTSTLLPGDVGGDFYCRLVPPSALAEWIIDNYRHSASNEYNSPNHLRGARQKVAE